VGNPLEQTKSIKSFRKELLRWYRQAKRNLPWRETSDPYAVWISEVMLQQTTVKTVMPRWRKFLERWPTLADLANDREENILHEWTGLGYYSRARNLYKAAKKIQSDFGGKFPEKAELLLSLPGMGKYTSAAVASIAFDDPVPVVDANVERVLARLYRIPGEIKSPNTKKKLEALAGDLLDRGEPGNFNQAMMELGALVCTPKNPRCSSCPVEKFCAARLYDTPENYPNIRKKDPMKRVREVALVIRVRGRVLVGLRPEGKSFAGMWEVPRTECTGEESSREAAKRLLKGLTGLDRKPESKLLETKHTVMRSRIALSVYRLDLESKPPTHRGDYADLCWLLPEQWDDLPKSTTQQDICRLLLNGKTSRQKRREESKLPENVEEDLFPD